MVEKQKINEVIVGRGDEMTQRILSVILTVRPMKQEALIY